MLNTIRTDHCTQVFCNASLKTRESFRSYLLCDPWRNFSNSKDILSKTFHILSKSSASLEAENLFDNIRWKLYRYNSSCEGSSSNFTLCLSDKPSDIFEDTCGIHNYNQDCRYDDAKLENVLIALSPLFFIYGICALVGNTVVIVRRIKYLKKVYRLWVHKEKVTYSLMILSLAVADFLTGICLTLYAAELNKNMSKRLPSIDYVLCNVIGSLTFLSNEISISTLVMITIFRLYIVLKPFDQMHIRKTIWIIVSIWSFWILLAVIPNLEFTQTLFHNGIRVTKKQKFDISFVSMGKFALNLLKHTNLTKAAKSVFEVAKHFSTPKLWLKTITVLGILSNDDVEHQKISIYNTHPLTCYMKSFVDFESPTSYFALTVTIYNFTACTIIFVAYITILQKMSQHTKISTWVKKNLLQKKKTVMATSDTGHFRKHIKDKKRLHRSVALIILTDCLVWIPITLFAVIDDGLQYNTDCETLKQRSSRLFYLQLLEICGGPLNSVINPYIFSFQIWKRLYKIAKRKFYKALDLKTGN